ncbi:putative ATP-dependent RNA helicase DDX43 [Haematobia irritans]|uniref:putative ATP-dependent RNA helicase DDX43 n=1 Tax=Haematobia irritans TaxID=7368 RepID=UPI003F500E57
MGFEPHIRKISLDIRPDKQPAIQVLGVRHFTDGYLNNPIPVRDVSLDLVEQTIEIVEENEKFYLMVFAIADIISGEVNNLIATDIASRGLAIEDITHVINFQFRNIEEYSNRALVIDLDPIWGIASELIPIPEEAGQDIPSDS